MKPRYLHVFQETSTALSHVYMLFHASFPRQNLNRALTALIENYTNFSCF